MNHKTAIRAMIVAVMVVLGGALVLLMSSSASQTSARAEAKKKAEANRVAAVQYTATHPPVPVIIKTGKEKTLYQFPTDGCVTVFLRGNWSDYPIGGKINFIDPSTGKVVFIDEPGKQYGSSLPAGDYWICKVSPDATGVEIWQ